MKLCGLSYKSINPTFLSPYFVRKITWNVRIDQQNRGFCTIYHPDKFEFFSEKTAPLPPLQEARRRCLFQQITIRT